MAVNHNYSVSRQLVESDLAIDVHLTGQLTARAITAKRRFEAGWGTASAMVGSSAWHLETISLEWSQSSPANQPIPNTCMIVRLLQWSYDLTYLIMVARGKLDHNWSQSLCFLEISFSLRIFQVPGALIITSACNFFIVVAGVDWLVILRINFRCFAICCRVGAQDRIVFIANARSKHWLRLRHL